MTDSQILESLNKALAWELRAVAMYAHYACICFWYSSN